MTAEDALEKIKDLVLNDCGGRRDEAIVSHVRRLLGCVPTNITIYASGKRDAIQRWCEIYWSPRRHKRYGGPRQVATSILGACDDLIRILPSERAHAEASRNA
jgi:hypothetical protein